MIRISRKRNITRIATDFLPVENGIAKSPGGDEGYDPNTGDSPVFLALPTHHCKGFARSLVRNAAQSLARIDPELLYPVKHHSAQAQVDLTVIRA